MYSGTFPTPSCPYSPYDIVSLVKVAFTCLVVVQFIGCRQHAHGYTPEEKDSLVPETINCLQLLT